MSSGGQPTCCRCPAVLAGRRSPPLCLHPHHSSRPLSSHCLGAAIFKTVQGSKITFFTRPLRAEGRKRPGTFLLSWGHLSGHCCFCESHTGIRV